MPRGAKGEKRSADAIDNAVIIATGETKEPVSKNRNALRAVGYLRQRRKLPKCPCKNFMILLARAILRIQTETIPYCDLNAAPVVQGR
jgi:hypothetical protein